ncbi:putative toxin-antitoxin system toxin component, PIN family [Hydrogenophaga sp.]|uniref:putative toxin-antitoxin system toxin component, PIN family n=1 Tax=Hydrogenophaga sp. TaxID=1904254 RepID=UPI003F6AAC4F
MPDHTAPSLPLVPPASGLARQPAGGAALAWAPAVPFVLDTNIALDLFVFADPATAPLRAAIDGAAHGWLATQAMREELARVLAYPQIVKRLAAQALAAGAVLEAFDQRVCVVPAAAKAAYTCKDPDDQKFIDLAVAHRAALVSKDAHVLSMTNRLARLGVVVCRQWLPPVAVAGAGPAPLIPLIHVAPGPAH